jgi:hypothetical protein
MTVKSKRARLAAEVAVYRGLANADGIGNLENGRCFKSLHRKQCQCRIQHGLLRIVLFHAAISLHL